MNYQFKNIFLRRKSFNNKRPFLNIKLITLMGLLMALGIVLNIFGRFIIILPIFGQLRLSVTIIILFVIGFTANPLLAFLVGFLIDVLAFFIGSTPGAFHIGFSFSSGLIAFISSIFTWFFIKKNSNVIGNKSPLIWFVLISFLVFLISILIIVLNPLSIDSWIIGIIVIIISIIALEIVFFITLKMKYRYLRIVFLVFFSIILNTFLSSLWLNNLLGLPYLIFLWPRLVKNLLFDWWILFLILFPLFQIINKKNYIWCRD